MRKTSTVRDRYDFVYLFDCQDGNPNGDPDFHDAPRVDPETMQGLVSDVCLKRKIRNYVSFLKSSDGTVEPGYRILVMSGQTLESQQRKSYEDLKIEPRTHDHNRIGAARAWMCRHFFDVRAFGAVMSTTDFNCGQVRGPVQITFARSIDRVMPTNHSITRIAFTSEDRARKTRGTSEMGRKHTIAYGLYRAHGFINAAFAAQTGFSEADLDLLWCALSNMFEIDRSAARGLMGVRGLYVFRHSSTLGNAHAHELFGRIAIALKPGVETPRNFADYTVSADDRKLPAGVTLLRLISGND